MTDTISREARSNNMRAIRSARTSIEDAVSRGLWNRGYRFRRNSRSLPGKPDISIKKLRIAIFIDSCFWHGCSIHYRLPKSNVDFWQRKIERNRQRDGEITEYYRSLGWTVMRIWEHEIRGGIDAVIDRISTAIEQARRGRGSSDPYPPLAADRPMKHFP